MITKLYNKKLSVDAFNLRDTLSSSFPRELHLDLVDGCNLRCKMCFIYDDDSEIKIVSDRVLKQLSDIAPFLEQVHIGCAGEAFLHKGLFKYVSMFKTAGAIVHVLTNGTALTNINIDKLISAGTDYLRISFDGASKNVFEDNRGGASFLKVTEGLRNLQLAKCEQGVNIPHVGFALTAMQSNFEELDELVRLAHELNVEFIDFGFLSVDRPILKLLNESLYFRQSWANEKLRSAKKLANDLGVTFTPRYFNEDVTQTDSYNINCLFPEDKNDVNFSIKDKRECYLPWSSIWVDAKGDVFLCNNIRIGSLFDSSIADIWNDVAAKNVREQASGTSNMCVSCSMCYFRNQNELSTHFAGVLALPQVEEDLSWITKLKDDNERRYWMSIACDDISKLIGVNFEKSEKKIKSVHDLNVLSDQLARDSFNASSSFPYSSRQYTQMQIGYILSIIDDVEPKNNIIDFENGVQLRFIYRLAGAFEHSCDYSAALRLFNLIAKSTPSGIGFDDQLGGSYFHLGEINRRLGNSAESLKAYSSCLDVIPSHVKARQLLGQEGILIRDKFNEDVILVGIK